VVLGIHIAAPALAIQPGDALDDVARERLSTVYMPGYKITMLPDAVVQAYTLAEGRRCRRCRCTSRWTRPRSPSRPARRARARAHRRQPAP
jgi:exoribonuclease II